MKFSEKLIDWYSVEKRDLPWRNTKNPYFVWLSEIILQQTRVDQGMAYYKRFITTFSTVNALATAEEEKVLNLWQGLGYYSRARNLHASAKYIVNELHGKFPNNYKEILKLKGVGDYTASAIASFCFGESTAVVDGNVYRFLSRYFGVETPIDTGKGNKEFKSLAQELIKDVDPAIFNQAIMEFGALQCKPKNPSCEDCPFIDSCFAYAHQKIDVLPVKKGKVKVSKKYFNYLVIKTPSGRTKIEQRTGKGIWQNLYQFPLVETDAIVSAEVLEQTDAFQKIFLNTTFELLRFNEKPLVHKLSHQHLNTTFWIIEVQQESLSNINWSQIEDYPLPILISKAVEEIDAAKIFSNFVS